MDTTTDLEELLCSTLAMACLQPRESISPATELAALRLDSLTFVSVIASVEQIYGKQLGEAHLASLMIVPDVRTLLQHLEPITR